MKKIIEGKRYNPATAESLAVWENRHPRSDFKWCREVLYRTPKGALFLHGKGGAMSPYSEPVGNNGRGGGEDIRPMTQTEALQWMEERGLADEIERHFPDAIEDA
ncbi:hypothetical protein [Geoalkalibacter sp.]|uniref:hypothetical protein n=1 Tax=Geoalkalibacter sp. TaxID=3041440 RepID=UPI00272DF19C|nr:hypothetical protein [Geoalkalibacter sp.]